MKTFLLILAFGLGFASGASAQDRIYRCGNEYTNAVTAEQSRDCKLVSGGNVTVIQSQRPPAVSAAAPRPAGSAPSAPSSRSDTADQRARDSDARLILESELKRAEARQAELLREYNDGAPEKLGPETRNHQKYLDRIAELKASIARNESDIAGIRRELGRLPGGSGATAAVGGQ